METMTEPNKASPTEPAAPPSGSATPPSTPPSGATAEATGFKFGSDAPKEWQGKTAKEAANRMNERYKAAKAVLERKQAAQASSSSDSLPKNNKP